MTESTILQVQYTCHGCGLKDVTVTVGHRKHGEEITAWVEKIQQWVANDHLARSPECTTRKCDLKIPVPEGVEGIGYAVAAKETPIP